MISDERLQTALTYLAESDSPAAEAKVEVERMKYKQDSVEKAIYLRETGNIEERKAKARGSQAYHDATEDYFDALLHYENYRNKRKTEEIVVETWRSLNANRRSGQI